MDFETMVALRRKRRPIPLHDLVEAVEETAKILEIAEETYKLTRVAFDKAAAGEIVPEGNYAQVKRQDDWAFKQVVQLRARNSKLKSWLNEGLPKDLIEGWRAGTTG